MENFENSEMFQTVSTSKAHVLAFTSGKGGVGKTCVTTNVASAMVHRGAKVCIFDADTGLANINILLGLRPEFTLEHVLSGEKTIQDVMIKTGEGLAVVPGASGISECVNLGGEEAKRLVDALVELESAYDFILIDTAAGVAESVLSFIESAPCAFLVITSEPTSLTDAFSLLKMLNARNYTGRLRVIVNMAVDYPGATETYRRFSSAVEKYLQLKVEYGGFVSRDENLPRSVALQMPVVELIANSPASRCLYALADNILKYIGSDQAESGLAEYWHNQISESDFTNYQDKPVEPAITAFSEEQPDDIRNAGQELVGNIPHKLSMLMKSQALDSKQLDDLISKSVALYAEEFGSFPQCFRQLIFRWLESENYAAPRIIELISTLESLYISRYQQPLFNLEDSTARLVAQTQGAESKLEALINQLRESFKLSFHHDVFDVQKEILNNIQQDDFSEERFEELLLMLREGFRARFNKPYQGQSELLLESTAEALQAMTENEQKLQDEIETMQQSFQQLTSRRDALLTAIKSAQNNIPINPIVTINS